jgi:hypothetical protein
MKKTEDPALVRAFAGCGLVLDHARTSKRYRELLRDYNGDTGAATLDLLGLSLVDKAWEICLPEPDKQQVQYWDQLTADEQIESLALFMRRLTNPPDCHAEPQTPDEAPYLPTKMGKWAAPGIQRNCLGIAILGTACIRQYPNTRHYFASVQCLAAEPVYRGLQEVYEPAISLIVSRLPYDAAAMELVAVLQDHIDVARETAQLLEEREQFHSGNILQLQNGQWALVDAYQHNVSVFPPEQPFSKVDASFRYNGNITAAVTLNGSPNWADIPAFSAEFGAIGLCANDQLIPALEDWSQRVWKAAQAAATSTPHYALSVSEPICSLAVRVLINERLRHKQPRVAIDLLRYSNMDTVLFHAIKDSLDGQPLTSNEQTLLADRIEECRRTPAIYRHPLLNSILEEVHG